MVGEMLCPVTRMGADDLEDLLVEKFEDRVLLSINPSTTESNPVWDYMLEKSIEYASDLTTYGADELEGVEKWVVGLPEDTPVDEAAEYVGAEVVETVAYLDDTYVWQFDTDMAWEEQVARLGTSKVIDYYYPLVAVEVAKMYAPQRRPLPRSVASE